MVKVVVGGLAKLATSLAKPGVFSTRKRAYARLQELKGRFADVDHRVGRFLDAIESGGTCPEGEAILEEVHAQASGLRDLVKGLDISSPDSFMKALVGIFQGKLLNLKKNANVAAAS